MSVFLLASFPLYLCLAHGSLRALRFAFWGLVTFIPVYVISRSIPNSGFFSWSILQIFAVQIWRTREAFFRIVAALILIVPILLRRLLRKNGYNHEFLCWLSGYFFALNFHDFLLLGPFPGARELFYGPLSRILFAQLLSIACVVGSGSESGVLRTPVFVVRAKGLVFCCFALFLAFFVLGLVSSLVMILNAYWFGSLVLLLALFVLFPEQGPGFFGSGDSLRKE